MRQDNVQQHPRFFVAIIQQQQTNKQTMASLKSLNSAYFLFPVTAIVFVVLDVAFLYLLQPLFRKQIQDVQTSGPLTIDRVAAVLCYLVLVFGLFYFVILPNRSPMYAFLLGLVVYAVYELTNKSILRKWRWETVVIDTLWGGVLFAVTTWLVNKLGGRN
jgi:uncharacterized membrane protein